MEILPNLKTIILPRLAHLKFKALLFRPKEGKASQVRDISPASSNFTRSSNTYVLQS